MESIPTVAWEQVPVTCPYVAERQWREFSRTISFYKPGMTAIGDRTCCAGSRSLSYRGGYCENIPIVPISLVGLLHGDKIYIWKGNKTRSGWVLFWWILGRNNTLRVTQHRRYIPKCKPTWIITVVLLWSGEYELMCKSDGPTKS